MRLRLELSLGVGALLAIQVVTSFAAIALLSRMAPAIARVRGENLVSIEAGERMLAALAEPPTGPLDARRASFHAALARARANVTEPAELGLLETVERWSDDALGGDASARARAVAAILELSWVNHASAAEADARAQRLGSAGAWAAVLLASSGFFFGVLVLRRLTDRIALPLADLHDAALALERGDPFRRTGHLPAPPELQVVARALDGLIDAHIARGAAAEPDRDEELLRRALLRLLDEAPTPRVVLDREGRVELANQRALELLAEEEGEGYRAALRAGAAGEPAPGVTCLAVGEHGWICDVTPATPDGEGSPE